MTRRILIIGEGATELRAPGERWSGCARVLLQRLFGAPSPDLLAFDERMLSRFRSDLNFERAPSLRGEDAQARIARTLASRDAHGLVLVRDNDQSERRPHGARRGAIERGFAEAHAQGHRAPAVLALAIECIEAWALADPEAWRLVYGKVPTLPSDPESLWGDVRDPRSDHPKCVLRRCFDQIERAPAGNAVALLLERASLELLAARCPRSFGQFVADLRRAFPPIACVVAASNDRAIGLDGAPPWGFDTLREHVHRIRGLAIPSKPGERIAAILGRKTWHAMPRLPAVAQRVEVVVTRRRDLEVPDHVIAAASFDDAVRAAIAANADRIVVLGGGALYREALAHFRCTELHYTRVDTEAPGADTWISSFDADPAWRSESTPTHHHDNGFDYQIERWSRFAT